MTFFGTLCKDILLHLSLRLIDQFHGGQWIWAWSICPLDRLGRLLVLLSSWWFLLLVLLFILGVIIFARHELSILYSDDLVLLLRVRWIYLDLLGLARDLW